MPLMLTNCLMLPWPSLKVLHCNASVTPSALHHCRHPLDRWNYPCSTCICSMWLCTTPTSGEIDACFDEDAAFAVFGASVATEAAFAATACGCCTARLLDTEADLARPSARPSKGVASAWSIQCDVEGIATCAKTDDMLAAQTSPTFS